MGRMHVLVFVILISIHWGFFPFMVVSSVFMQCKAECREELKVVSYRYKLIETEEIGLVSDFKQISK